MNEYLVWDANDVDKGDSGLKQLTACNVQHAAEIAAEEYYVEWDYPTEMRLNVEDVLGAVWVVVVTVEAVPNFVGRLET